MRLKHQTIIDYYETIAGILLELLGILLGILPDVLGLYWECYENSTRSLLGITSHIVD